MDLQDLHDHQMVMVLICHTIGMVLLLCPLTMVPFMDYQEMPLPMNTKSIQVLVLMALQDLQDPQVPQEDVIPLQ